MKKFYLIFALLISAVFILPAQIIEIVGKGSQDSTSIKLYISNADNIDEIKAEAIIWGSASYKSSPAEVEFADADDTFSGVSTETEHREYNTADDPTNPVGYSGFFQAEFTDIDEGSIDLDIPASISDITYSAYAFIYRDLIAPTYYSVADYDHAEFYRNGSTDPYEVVFDIDETDYKKNLRVLIPITELNVDNRYGVVTVTAGSVSVTDTIYDYNSNNPSYYLQPILLKDVEGDETEVVVSIYSPGATEGDGDSFITSGVVLDVMCDKYCTLTQHFYGSNCAKFCGCNRASDILFDLLEQDLVIGGNGNTLTLTQDDVSCVISRLPGWGASVSLDGEATCSNPVGIYIKYGRFKNSLLNQTITLGLNLRLTPELADLELEDRYMKTIKVKDCSEADCEPKTGCRVKKTYHLPVSVLDALGDDNTVDDLYAMANAALAGEDMGDLPLYKIARAVGKINCGFNYCKILDKFSSYKEAEIGEETVSDMMEFNVFPNPVSTNATVEFTSITEERTTVEVYNMMGVRTAVLMDDFAQEDLEFKLNIDASAYPAGMYIVVVQNGDNVMKSKFTVVK